MSDCLKKYIFMKYFLGLVSKTSRFGIIIRHFVNTAVFYTRGERKKSLMHQRWIHNAKLDYRFFGTFHIIPKVVYTFLFLKRWGRGQLARDY